MPVLQKHISKHTDSDQFKCPICKNQIKSLIGLKHHVLDHTGEAPYRCVICDSTFKQKVLAIHQFDHTHQENVC